MNTIPDNTVGNNLFNVDDPISEGEYDILPSEIKIGI
jgi:hypothetical protein